MQKFRQLFASLRSIVKMTTNLVTASSGFTMIELLVVIAVIGILAVAVLSSINPIEQINKGRDTRTRSDAAQLINAVDRYFAIHEVYPWNTTSPTFTPTVAEYSDEFTFSGPNAADDWNWVDVLATTAEVKEGFLNRLKNDDNLFIYKENDTNATMYACFIPTSKAFQFEAAKNCFDGSTPVTVGAFTTCVTTDNTIDPDNMICLP